MSDQELSPEQLKAVDQIQKLLNLAAKNPNEHEAAAAAAKAAELLAKYNLDAAVVENAKPGEGKREELKVEGGFYRFQRELWDSVARLNFCAHWNQQYWVEDWRYIDDYSGAKSMTKGEGKTRQKVKVMRYRHALVGRIVNTRTTIVMAQYLEQAIERVTRDRLKDYEGETGMSNWANSFRRGCSERVAHMVNERRHQVLSEEKKKQRAAEKGKGSGATTLTLRTYIDQETDANNDFIHGEGWSAKQAKIAAERAEARRRADQAYTQWAKDNPNEARKEWEWTDPVTGETWSMGHRSRGGGRDTKANVDYGAFNAGYEAGKGISLDQQTGGRNKQERIGK